MLLAAAAAADAPGAARLAADWPAAACAVLVAACDVADRRALAGCWPADPAGAPVTRVVHAAGVLAMTAWWLDDPARGSTR